MGTWRKPYASHKEAGRQAKREGKQKFEYPPGMTRTQCAFWVLGWEEECDKERAVMKDGYKDFRSKDQASLFMEEKNKEAPPGFSLTMREHKGKWRVEWWLEESAYAGKN